MTNTLQKAAIKIPCALSIVGAALLGGCSLPAYIPKTTHTVPIVVLGNDGSGFTLIQKLDANCQPEARFENAIGANPRFIHVDAEPEFSFRIVTWPTLCAVQNTLTLDGQGGYRILINIPAPTARQRCGIRAEGNQPWQPARLTGKCGVNQREGM